MSRAAIGRIVHYTLASWDAQHINAQLQGLPGANPVSIGDVLPGVIVRVWGPATANLQLLLDGPGTHWVTSRCEGQPGQHGSYIWPLADRATEMAAGAMAAVPSQG